MKKTDKKLDDVYIRIKKRRTELGISQEALAHMIGHCQSDISKLENIGIKLFPKDYRSISQALQVDYNYLFSSDGEEFSDSINIQQMNKCLADSTEKLISIEKMQHDMCSRLRNIERELLYVHKLTKK